MTWARPDLLALLLLVPIAMVVAVLVERTRGRHLAALAALEVLPSILPPGLRRSRAWQAVLGVVTMLALALAAAGPRLGFEWQQQKLEGVSIVVVLDVSRSMDAQDVSPSRIERARREILDLVGLLRGDAVGLVIFAAGPYVRIPLTVDYDTFVWAVKDSSSDTIRAQGSALAGALEAATGLLRKAEGSGKAILLVSDGESHDDPAALDAALAGVREADARVYALGIGEPGGAPIPLEEGGFKKDASGSVVLSRLDEDVLQRLAAATGGAYVRAVASDEDVRALYETEIRGKLDASERGVRREKLWHERFQWPLGLALVTLSVSAALGVGRRRTRTAAKALAAGIAVVAALTLSEPAFAGAAQDGQVALQSQQWDRAADLLGQARVEDPGNLDTMRGLAEALYRSGRVREAEQLFRTLAAQDPSHRAVHLYNAGNAAYKGGRLADALADFREAAKADPELRAAQTNATAVEREMAARVEPPPPPESDDASEPQDGQADEGQQAGQQEGQPGEQGEQAPKDGAQPEDGGAEQQGEGEPGQQEPGQQGPGKQEPPPGPSEQEAGGDGEQADDGGRREGAPTADGEGEPSTEQPGADGEATVSSSGEGDGEAPTGDEGGAGSGSGDMTPEQAARLVDSVPDGTPRVVVGGHDTEKDW